ncbi:hypothetical protein PspLS_09970 [Pyricularia sp. CBS 133598]|nr:hypothetical protein PspLS_09970 [Pyricularia sp. CBS 133598]
MSNPSFAEEPKASEEHVDVEKRTVGTLEEDAKAKGKAREIELDTDNVENSDQGRESSEQQSTVLVGLTIGVCLVAFAVGLDNTVLATAIPRITAEFNSLDNAAWYRSASFVASAGLQLPLAKLYTYFDAKWTYLASLAVFELGCVICSIATSPSVFIAGRAVSGVGAAGLYPGVVNILGLAASAKLRPLLFAIVTAAVGVASLVGPSVGGVFTDSSRLTWRWCFWVNLPIGGVAGAIVLLALRLPWLSLWNKTDTARPPAKRHPEQILPLTQKLLQLDPLGTIFLSAATASLLLALQWGGVTTYWTDKPVWGCLAAAGLLFSAFAFVQRYLRDPAAASIPPSLLRSPTVLASALLGAALSAALFAHVFLLPFYFQAVRGTSATGSGLRMLAYLGAAALGGVAFGAGWASGRVGGRHGLCAFLATGVFVVGAGLLHTLGVDTPPGTAAAYQVVAGVSMGVAWQVPFVAVQQQQQQQEQRARDAGVGGHGVANALVACANSFGAALGIFAVQNIFLGTLASGLGDVVALRPEQVDAILRAGRLPGMRDPVFLSPLLLDEVLEAFANAVDAAFVFPVVSGVLAFLASLILLW